MRMKNSRHAAARVAWWAAFAEPHRNPLVAPVGLCRRGLIGGHARDLEYLTADADLMERDAAALRVLIAHVAATHPLARRRQRAAAASS